MKRQVMLKKSTSTSIVWQIFISKSVKLLNYEIDDCNVLIWNLKCRSLIITTNYLIILRLLQPCYKVENIANPWCFQACGNLAINKVATT